MFNVSSCLQNQKTHFVSQNVYIYNIYIYIIYTYIYIYIYIIYICIVSYLGLDSLLKLVRKITRMCMLLYL